MCLCVNVLYLIATETLFICNYSFISLVFHMFLYFASHALLLLCFQGHYIQSCMYFCLFMIDACNVFCGDFDNKSINYVRPGVHSW